MDFKEECELAVAEIVRLYDTDKREAAVEAFRKFSNESKINSSILESREYFLGPLKKLTQKWIEKEGFVINGLIDRDTSEFSLAIENFNKAIEIDPTYSLPYRCRADANADLGEKQKAFSDYEIVIRLNPRDATAYNNRGFTYFEVNEMEKAIENYDKALEINPQFILAYINRGRACSELGDKQKARMNFSLAIQIDPKYANAYYYQGLILADQANDLEAITEFEKFIELSKNNFWKERAKEKIEELRARLLNAIVNKVAALVDQIIAILRFEGDQITHYTGLTIAKLLTFQSSSFRVSEASFMNDTSEGKELFRFLKPCEAFQSDGQRQSNSFLEKPFFGSFVASEVADDLTMWRMYGKDTGIEATGASITLDRRMLIEALSQKIKPKSENDTSQSTMDVFQLFQVAYFKDEGHVILPLENDNDKAVKLKVIIGELKTVLEEAASSPKIDEFAKNIRYCLSKIMYLFKSAQYQYEKEVRLMVSRAGFDVIVNHSDVSSPRVYIELAPIYKAITCVVLGPKVPRADEWAAAFYYFLQKEGVKIDVRVSQLPYK